MRRKPKSAGRTTIKVPTPLYEKLSHLIDGSGYSSVTEFIVYVLRDLVGQCEEAGKQPTAHELGQTRRRLENLGYL